MSSLSLSTWVSAARPRTLGASVAPVVMAAALAYTDGMFHLLSVVAALSGALLIQIGTNFANDYFDFKKGADTPKRVGPTRAVAAGLIAPWVMFVAMVVTFALVFIPGLYILQRGGMPFLAIGLVSIACGILYTGGPFPLAYVGLGDLFVLIFFGPVALAGTYYLQAFDVDNLILIAGLSPGLFSVAILTVNNLRDIKGDKRAKKRTLAVRFGKTFAKFEYLLALTGAIIVIPGYMVYISGGHYWALVSWASLIVVGPSIGTVLFREGAALNGALANTGKALLIFSVLFSIGWVI